MSVANTMDANGNESVLTMEDLFNLDAKASKPRRSNLTASRTPKTNKKRRQMDL